MLHFVASQFCAMQEPSGKVQGQCVSPEYTGFPKWFYLACNVNKSWVSSVGNVAFRKRRELWVPSDVAIRGRSERADPRYP